MPYIEMRESIFISYKERSYVARARGNAERIGYQHRSQLVPWVREESPYKLHISLAQQSYTQCKDAIVKILLKHLENRVIDDFKLINNNALVRHIENVQEVLRLALEYKAMTEAPSMQWVKDYYFACIGSDIFKSMFLNCDYSERCRRILDKNQIDDFIHGYKRSIRFAQRFLDSDQFTIYIPQYFDREKILNLCREIDYYLTEKRADSSKVNTVASPIGEYINFRQEYLLAHFHEMNRTGYKNKQYRISSVQECDDDEEEVQRRIEVLAEQETSTLYQYLKNGIEDIYVNFLPPLAYSLEHRLATEELKKAQMAIVPYVPLLTALRL